MRRALWFVLVSACEPAGLQLHAAELARLGGDEPHNDAEHFRSVLWQALSEDVAYPCAPSVRDALGPPVRPRPAERIRGVMPHYGWYYGPMGYRLSAERGPNGALGWVVRVRIALDPPAESATLELPDCALDGQLAGLACAGTPYDLAPGVEACPESGAFTAPATTANVRVLLAQWSREVEGYYNRDAERFGLPVRYDFDFVRQDDPPCPAGQSCPIDVRMPLGRRCERLPYFAALRAGWSIPVLAHEMGHFLGLFDEYEPLSGALYPKTPHEGSERARMGLSMKRHTRFYPLHHYLILRRFHCGVPATRDPYALE